MARRIHFLKEAFRLCSQKHAYASDSPTFALCYTSKPLSIDRARGNVCFVRRDNQRQRLLVNCTDTRWVRSNLAQVQLQRERRPRRASERQVACAQLHSDGWGCWGAARPGCLETLHIWAFSKVKIPCLMVPSGRVRIIGHLNERFGCLWVRLVRVPCLFQGVRSCP